MQKYLQFQAVSSVMGGRRDSDLRKGEEGFCWRERREIIKSKGGRGEYGRRNSMGGIEK